MQIEDVLDTKLEGGEGIVIAFKRNGVIIHDIGFYKLESLIREGYEVVGIFTAEYSQYQEEMERTAYLAGADDAA